MFHQSKEFEREEQSPSSIVVDVEEEYEVDAILGIRENDPGACN